MKLNLEATAFTIKQRIEELLFWLSHFPDSEFAPKRRAELEAAREQLKKIEEDKK